MLANVLERLEGHRVAFGERPVLHRPGPAYPIESQPVDYHEALFVVALFEVIRHPHPLEPAMEKREVVLLVLRNVLARRVLELERKSELRRREAAPAEHVGEDRWHGGIGPHVAVARERQLPKLGHEHHTEKHLRAERMDQLHRGHHAVVAVRRGFETELKTKRRASHQRRFFVEGRIAREKANLEAVRLGQRLVSPEANDFEIRG